MPSHEHRVVSMYREQSAGHGTLGLWVVSGPKVMRKDDTTSGWLFILRERRAGNAGNRGNHAACGAPEGGSVNSKTSNDWSVVLEKAVHNVLNAASRGWSVFVRSK